MVDEPPRSRGAFPQDADLTPDARGYVLSLRSVDARNDARDYARMDEQLFRARIGPAIDELLSEVKALRAIESARKISKKQIAAIFASGGVLLEVLRETIGRLQN